MQVIGDTILFAILFPKDTPPTPQYYIIPLNFPVLICELYFYVYAILSLFFTFILQFTSSPKPW